MPSDDVCPNGPTVSSPEPVRSSARFAKGASRGLGTPNPQAHEGHEWLYVLSGQVRLVLGDEELVLAAGEAAEFSTSTPHWMSGVGGPAEVLVLMGHHGERAHLRVGATSS